MANRNNAIGNNALNDNRIIKGPFTSTCSGKHIHLLNHIHRKQSLKAIKESQYTIRTIIVKLNDNVLLISIRNCIANQTELWKKNKARVFLTAVFSVLCCLAYTADDDR